MLSIGQRLNLTRGKSSGADYLRLALATSVIAWHTILVSYGSSAETPILTGPFRPLPYFILPGFFSLSGFLVAGSLARNSVPKFLMLRALRIFPALFGQVLVSAFVIGPLLTSMPLHDYFTDAKFRSYLLNMAGLMHYQLPGLFLNNPFPDNVNIQLWTIKLELECYAALAVLGLLGFVRSRYLLAATFVLLSTFFLASAWFGPGEVVNEGANGRLCLLSFAGGVCVYAWRDQIPSSGALALVAFSLAWGAFVRSGTEYLAPLPVAYLTAWLGLCDPTRNFLVDKVDYSYGIYLYGFPVQQAVAQILPQHRYWYVNLVLSLVITGVAAVLSWHLIESRAMNLKALISQRQSLKDAQLADPS